MNRLFFKMTTFAVASVMTLFAMTGCDEMGLDEYDNAVGQGDIIDPNSNGYISFSDFALVVDNDSESYTDQDVESDVVSRSESLDVSDYRVVITSETSGETIFNDTYAVAIESDNIKLSAGYYILQVSSVADLPATEWGNSHYISDETRLTIGDERVTSIGSVTCRLATIKSRVYVSADMMEQFDTSEGVETPFEVTLMYGSEDNRAELTYDINKLYSTTLSDVEIEARSGCFAPQDDEDTIDILMSGMYNIADDNNDPDYITLSWSGSISGVAAGQLRDISIKVENYDKGNVLVSFEVEGWAYDTPLGVSVFSSFAVAMQEDELTEPDSTTSDKDSATISFDNGNDISSVYQISDSTIDLFTETYSPTYKLTATPETGATITTISLVASSTNTTFMDALTTAGYVDGAIAIWQDGAAVSGLSSYITMIESSSTGAIGIGLKYAAIEALYKYSGEHTFTMTTVDSEGRRSYTPLYFNVTSSGGVAPTITWDGGEFGVYYDITDSDLSVILKITSEVGLESVSLTINSDVLTDSALGEIDLATEMDLAAPATDEMAEMLSDVLGFPIKDEVIGEKELTVDISDFMPMLSMLVKETYEGTSYTDFVITVKDANGDCTETLMVKLVNETGDDDYE